MERRLVAVLLAVPIALLAVAAPAQALSPKDAQGCENKKAAQLEDYCKATGG